MKAAVLRDTGQLIIEDRPIPKPNDGEIIVRVVYAGICRTDRKAYRMSQQDLHMPRVLGHEISGVIHDLDENISGYKVGDAVQVHPGIGCGDCVDCRNGNDQICDEMEILGFHIDGGFAEYCRIPKKGVDSGIVQKIPKSLPKEIAVYCEPLACVINIFERLKPKSHEKLILNGSGALGLLAATLGKINGMQDILLLEKDSYKIETAKKLGFACLPANAPKEEILTTLHGSPDIAIPCCPNNNAVALDLSILKKRGRFGFFSGLTSENALDRNTLNLIHYKELSVFGSYGCGKNHGKKALRILAKNQQQFNFPTTMISLDDLEKNLQSLEVTDTIFKVLHFEEDTLS